MAFEAVAWIKANVEGVETYAKAVEVLHGLLEAKLIRHASGDANLPFNNGFYLFAIVEVTSTFNVLLNKKFRHYCPEKRRLCL